MIRKVVALLAISDVLFFLSFFYLKLYSNVYPRLLDGSVLSSRYLNDITCSRARDAQEERRVRQFLYRLMLLIAAAIKTCCYYYYQRMKYCENNLSISFFFSLFFFPFSTGSGENVRYRGGCRGEVQGDYTDRGANSENFVSRAHEIPNKGQHDHHRYSQHIEYSFEGAMREGWQSLALSRDGRIMWVVSETLHLQGRLFLRISRNDLVDSLARASW